MAEFEIEAGIHIPEREIQAERSRIEDQFQDIPVSVDAAGPGPQPGDLSTSLGGGGSSLSTDGGADATGGPVSVQVADPIEIDETAGRLTGRRRRRARREFRLNRQQTTLSEEQLKTLEDIEDAIGEGGGGGGGGLLGGGGGAGLLPFGLGALAGGGGLGTGLGLGLGTLGTLGAAGLGGAGLGLGGVRLLQEAGVIESVREGGEEAGETIPDEVVDAVELVPGLSIGTAALDLAQGDFSLSRTQELFNRRDDTFNNVGDFVSEQRDGGDTDFSNRGPEGLFRPGDPEITGADTRLETIASQREDPDVAGQDGVLNQFRDEFGLGAERDTQETRLPGTLTDAVPDAFGAADRRVGQDAPPVGIPDDRTRSALPDALGAGDRRVGPNRTDTLPTAGPSLLDRPGETDSADRGPGFRTPQNQPGVNISAEASPKIENTVNVAFDDLRSELQDLNRQVERDVVGEIDRVERDLRDEIEDLQRQIRRAN